MIQKCSNCDKEKEYTAEFFQWYKKGNRLHFQCKECMNEKVMMRRERKRHPELYPIDEIKYTEDGIKIKKCIGVCGLEKSETEEFFSWRTDNKTFRNECKDCRADQNKIYYDNNIDKILKNKKDYRSNLTTEQKEKVNIKRKIYYDENAEYFAEYRNKYYEENKREILDHNQDYTINKIKIDPVFKCMKMVSAQIAKMLKSQGSSKNGVSCRGKLPFTAEELWTHLESLFTHPDSLGPNGEIWMTKNNHGKYVKSKWNDKDPSTWKWEIDHIDPQAILKFDSYDHPNFLKCWALENLRPYSAKQNQKDGATRVRHR